MITIYKHDGTVRLTKHESSDSYVSTKISDEEFAQINFVSGQYINFEVGDYILLYGLYFTLYKIASPLAKNSTHDYSYQLKFESPRADMDNVNLQLFDNTTSEQTPAYNPLTTYSKGNVVAFHTLYWECISDTPISGISPEEGTYWQVKSNVTYEVSDYSATKTYTHGDMALYNDTIWKHIGSVDTTGVHPEEGDKWTQITTAPDFDFSSVLTPRRWAQLFCDNMNRARPKQNWTVGYAIPDQPKEQAFSNVSVLSALASTADIYETEFWIGQTSHNNYTVNIGKKANSTSLSMEYGKNKGLKDINRVESSGNKKITRLVALGGTKNLLGSYRGGSKRLLLPDGYYLDSDNIDLSNPLEGTMTWDDIYPCMLHATNDWDVSVSYAAGDMVLHNSISWTCLVANTGQTPTEGTYWQITEGTVTNAVSEFKFIDKNLTFNPIDPNLVMKDGTIPKIHFITGNLAGYEFPIADYNKDTKQIAIQQIQDANDSYLPTAGYTFGLHDQFNIVDFYMPDEYISKAENYLKAKAIEWLQKYSIEQVSYRGTIDTVWASVNQIELHAGDLIQMVDVDFGINTQYRITEVKRYITEGYKYEITIDDTPYIPSKIQSIINSTTKNNTYIQYNSLDTQMAKVRTYKGASEAIGMAFDPESKYFTDGIAPLFVKSAMALFGTNTQQYSLTGVIVTTYSNTPNIVSWSAGTIIDSTQQSTDRTWNIAGGSFTATDNDTSYYAYIRCNATIGSSDAIILFTETQYKVNSDSNYYYFLLGTLTKLSGAIRQFFTSNGFTFINGNTITTGIIKSQNGNSYFDLDNDEMHFGDAEKYVEWKNSLLKIKGTLAVSPSGVESAIGVFRGTYAINTLYYNGDTVTYGGSTWRYINSTPAQNVTPIDGDNWTNISAKGEVGQTGATGNGIGSVSITYQLSTSGTIPPTGTWLSSIPSVPAGRYLWTRTVTTYTDSTISISYTVGMMGETGSTGADGTNGVGISSTTITYQASPNGTTVPTGTWTSSIPSVSAGEYLWTKTVWNYTDSTTATGYSVGMMGATGATGSTGITGNYFEHRYAVNGSNTEAPSIVNTDAIPSGWTTTLPSMTLYQFMWITTAEKTATGTLIGTWSNPQRFSGAQGAQGSAGPAMSFYGTWSASNIYIGSATVVSVVLYNSIYYIARYDVGGSFTSSTAPDTDTEHWNSMGASFSSVATGLLLAQEAYVDNLIVSKLSTTSNPYRMLLSVLDSSLGIFRNKEDTISIGGAIIALGKDISEHELSGMKKPALVIVDRQWKGFYNALTIYYKDDRVYYASTNATYIFSHDWLETETPAAGLLPTNTTYWTFINNGNLGGGKYSEIGSEGAYLNGSNIRAIGAMMGVEANTSLALLLQKRNSHTDGFSTAIFGNDQTNDSDTVNQSKSYGGWFNRLFVVSEIDNVFVTSSDTQLILDKKSYHTIHYYGSSEKYINLPLVNYRDVGLKITIRKCGTGNIVVVPNGVYIRNVDNINYSSVTMHGGDKGIFVWDGITWVYNYIN